MDTLTHALSGAVLARATDGPERALTGKSRVWLGFLAGAFPDIDFVLSFVDPMLYLNEHRGPTHSLILLPFWAALVAWLYSFVLRGRVPWRHLVPVSAMAILIHILGDLITSFGTQILSPFDKTAFAWNTTFIIDPVLTTSLLLGLFLGFGHPQGFARGAIVACLAWIGFQAIQMHTALDIGERFRAERGLDRYSVNAFPQPFSPYRWKVLVSGPEEHYRSWVDLKRTRPAPAVKEDDGRFARLDKGYSPYASPHWDRISRFGERDPSLARSVWNDDAFAAYRRFARYPALVKTQRHDGRECAWFRDLRFASPASTAPFRYGLCRSMAGGPWELEGLPRSFDAPSRAPEAEQSGTDNTESAHTQRPG
ncbi:MAG: metal-dependent hydrolase [Gammaproteobacteria bacterium]